MSWGLELWDQFESVDKHCQQNIDFTEKYSKFVKERTTIEQEYASKIRKLAKAFQLKKRHEDRSVYSTYKAFQAQLDELNAIANQHELVAEEMMEKIVTKSLQCCAQMKQEKKKFHQDGRDLHAKLESLDRQVESSKKKFEKEWKDSERLHANYERLDNDCNATKADVEKAKQVSLTKKDFVETCKRDYGSALVKFNEAQKLHYHQEMPKIFEMYRNSDEERALKLQEFMVAYSEIDCGVKPLIIKCLDLMKEAAQAINPELDAKFVVDRHKSGFPMPGDKEFEDYTAPNRNSTEVDVRIRNDSKPAPAVNSSGKNKKGLSWLFGNKKVVESPDFSHLPPEQRKQRLQAKINDIRREIEKEDQGRNGLLKMQNVYKNNTSLGDPNEAQREINLITTKLEKLNQDLQKHETWFTEATGSKPAAAPSSSSSSSLSSSTTSPPQRPTPPTSSSVVTSSSSSSVIPPAPPLASNLAGIPPAPQLNTAAPSAAATTNSIAEVEAEDESQGDRSFADDFDEDSVEPVGTCEALYDYDASSEGEMSMKAGEEFQVLEADSGDGWTRVMSNLGDGYVPTSYIDIKFFY